MPATLEADFDLSRLAIPFAQLTDATGPLWPVVERYMIQALDVLEAQIVARTPVNLGTLRGSIARGEPVARGTEITGQIETASPYGEFVEYGRAQGRWPPEAPIAYWITRKLGITDPAELAQATFLIRRKIGTNGTPGAFMFRDGFQAALPAVETIFDTMLSELVTAWAGSAP